MAICCLAAAGTKERIQKSAPGAYGPMGLFKGRGNNVEENTAKQECETSQLPYSEACNSTHERTSLSPLVRAVSCLLVMSHRSEPTARPNPDPNKRPFMRILFIPPCDRGPRFTLPPPSRQARQPRAGGAGGQISRVTHGERKIPLHNKLHYCDVYVYNLPSPPCNGPEMSFLDKWTLFVFCDLADGDKDGIALCFECPNLYVVRSAYVKIATARGHCFFHVSYLFCSPCRRRRRAAAVAAVLAAPGDAAPGDGGADAAVGVGPGVVVEREQRAHGAAAEVEEAAAVAALDSRNRAGSIFFHTLFAEQPM